MMASVTLQRVVISDGVGWGGCGLGVNASVAAVQMTRGNNEAFLPTRGFVGAGVEIKAFVSEKRGRGSGREGGRDKEREREIDSGRWRERGRARE